MDADDDGAVLVDDGGDSTTSVELVADTLAEAAGAVWLGDGLVDVAAQPPTEIATKAATLARTATDGYRIERLLWSRRDGPPEGPVTSIRHSHQVDAGRASNVPRVVHRPADHVNALVSAEVEPSALGQTQPSSA